MNCCQNEGLEREFDPRRVARKLADYRRNGPEQSTKLLIDALLARNV